MFVHEFVPSGRVNMFALSRPLYVGKPPTTPPAWASPISLSFCRVPPEKLRSWAFQCCSSKPKRYDQSCIRLCMANGFTVAAEMSFPEPTTKLSGSHLVSNQTFVHGYT